MPKFKTTLKFFGEDYPRTLFPLKTNYIVITKVAENISDYIQNKILTDEQAFLPQTRVYAAKQSLHMRRTVKLDPVAEFFIYDLVARNRNTFRKNFNNKRRNFGYTDSFEIA